MHIIKSTIHQLSRLKNQNPSVEKRLQNVKNLLSKLTLNTGNIFLQLK